MLRREDAVLVVVDVQGRLLPFIHDADVTVENIVRLVRGFRLLDTPILVTEQYTKGLGPTDPRIVEALSGAEAARTDAGEAARAGAGEAARAGTGGSGQDRAAERNDAASSGASRPDPQDPVATPSPELARIEKMSFSCAADPGFMEALEESGRRQVLLCGIESHVCVQQTALHLVEAGYEVHLAADAVSSRSPRNVEIALRRMAQEGVLLTSAESAVFEMLQVCGTAEFKRWSRIIR